MIQPFWLFFWPKNHEKSIGGVGKAQKRRLDSSILRIVSPPLYVIGIK